MRREGEKENDEPTKRRTEQWGAKRVGGTAPPCKTRMWGGSVMLREENDYLLDGAENAAIISADSAEILACISMN